MATALDLKIKIRALVDGIKGIVGLNKTIEKTGQESERAAKKSGKLAGAWDKLKGAALALGAAMGIKQLLDVNREFERLHGSLVTATGDAELADKAFAGIQQFASETPYSVQQVTEAFVKLTNMGLTPSEEALTSYGNTASAMGKDLNQMIEAVADAATGEFERLKEFGIKSKSEGDKVSFTFRGVTTTVAKEASAIEGYLLNIGNTQFAGGIERQANTLNGAFSNMGDAWDNLLNKLLNDESSSGIQTMIRGIGDALNWVANVGIVHFQGAAISGLVAVQNGFTRLSTTSQVVWASIQAAGTGAINILEGAMASFVDGLATALDAIGADETAASMRGLADSLRPVSSAYDDLQAKIAKLNTEQEREISIRDRAAAATIRGLQAQSQQKASLDSVVEAMGKSSDATSRAAGVTAKAADGADELAKKTENVATANIKLTGTTGELFNELVKVHQEYRQGALSAKEFGAQTTALHAAINKQRAETAAAAQAAEDQAAAAETAASANDKMAESARGGGGAAAFMAKMLLTAKEQMNALSEAAGRAFEATYQVIQSTYGGFTGNKVVMGQAADAAAAYTARIKVLTEEQGRLRHEHILASNSFSKWMKATTIAANNVEIAFLKQSRAAEVLNRQLEGMSGVNERQLRSLEQTIEGYGLLDDSTLDNLRGQVQQLRQEQESLQDSVASTIRSLKDEIDLAEGNQLAIEQRRYQTQRSDLQAQAQGASPENAASIAEALRLLEVAYQQRVGKIKEDQAKETARAQPKTTIELKGPDGSAVTGEYGDDDAAKFVRTLQSAGLRAS